MEKAILAKVYREICQGFSEGTFLKKKFFFKHFDSLDFSLRDELYEREVKISLSRGLPKKREREEQVEKLGLWGEDQKRKLELINSKIESMRISLSRSKDSSQKKEIEDMIKRYFLEKEVILEEKRKLIGATAEEDASKKADEDLIVNNIYTSEKLEYKFFEEEDYEYLSQYEKFIFENEFWGNIFSNFTQKNIKRIAFKNYFLRPFSVSKENFFKRSGLSLTNWQLDLLNYGDYAQHILSQCSGKNIPEELMEEPEKIEEWILDEEKRGKQEKEEEKLNKNIDRVFKNS